MRDDILKSAFDAVYDKEFDVSSEELSEHTFSRRHQKAMKKLFKRAESDNGTPTKARISKRKKIIMIAAAGFVAVTGAVIMLCGSMSFPIVTKYFRGYKNEVAGDMIISLYPKSLEGCPTEIEQTYYFPEIPEELESFVLESEGMNKSKDGYILDYETPIYPGMQSTEHKYFTLNQITKAHCNKYPIQIYDSFETVDINGFEGIYEEKIWEPWGLFTCSFTWDNGDYILEVATKGIDKETTFALARSVAVNPVQNFTSDTSEPAASVERPTN